MLAKLFIVRLSHSAFFLSGLWAVVNNAGVAVFAETEWCTMEAYERVIGVNLLGTIRVTKACLPLVRRARGRVVNISSLAGKHRRNRYHILRTISNVLITFGLYCPDMLDGVMSSPNKGVKLLP